MSASRPVRPIKLAALASSSKQHNRLWLSRFVSRGCLIVRAKERGKNYQ